MGALADKLIKGSFLRVSNLLVTIVVTFFMMPFVIRSLGDRWYGLWILVGTFVGYYGFFDLGLSSAIQRFVSRALGEGDNTGMSRVFNTCLVMFIIAGLLSLVISIVVAAISPAFIDDPTDIHIFRVVIMLIGLDMALSFPVRAFEGFLYANVRFDVVNIIEISKLLTRTAFIVVFLLRGHGIIALALITLSVDIVSYLCVALYVRRSFPGISVDITQFERGRIRQLFSYSIYSFLSNVANKLRFHVDSFVITGFLGLSFVTHYNIGARISMYYMLLITSATALMMPVFSRLEGMGDYEQIRDKFVFVSKLNAIFSVFIGGSILIYGKAFITRWMGSAYLDSFHVLLVLIIGLVFNTIQITSVTLLYSLSKHKLYSVIVMAEGAANLLLSLLLVRRYGIIGVAMGTTIPMLVTSLFIVPVYANRVISLDISRYIKAVLGGILLGAALHFGSWLLVRDLMLDSYRRILMLGIATSAVYLAVNMFVLLDRDERRCLKVPI